MLSRKAEDYLEAIVNIMEFKGYIRVKDIASSLDVSSSSVVEMMKKLDSMGLVIYKKHDGIRLTPKGGEIGRMVKFRHKTIKDFLEIIDVPEDIADKDACTMEHNLNTETVEQIKKLVEFVKTAPDYPQWLVHFQIFCKTGEHGCKKDK
ncbi:MAG: metal-dependent transcriptional regulator [Halobacteriota archaeon]|nr:metal-dependent transcriptional regulator [Halobacteriota archaeon]